MEDKIREIASRSGDMLNTFGVLRSIMLFNNCLKRVQYDRVVAANYGMQYLDSAMPDWIVKKISDVWKESILMFSELNLLESSSPDEIRIKNLKNFIHLNE